MKKLSIALRAFVLAVVLACLTAAPALADEYTYTVRVFGGDKGTYNGSSTYTDPTAYKLNDICTLDLSKAAANEDKYYPKGFRIAGTDELLTDLNFPVTEDTDIVVAYGVKGDMVQYTINFVEDGTGNALTSDAGRSSVTYWGKIGDKPVVAAEFIEGYRPLYNNITGTLKEGTNNWDLPYVAIEVGEGTETVTTQTVYVDGGTTVIPGGGGTTTGGAAAGGAAAGGAAGGAAGTTEGGAAATTPTTPAAPPTQEILDVDNPLASPDANGTGTGTGEQGTGTENIEGDGNPAAPGQSAFSPALTAGIAAGAALVAGLIIYLMRKNKDQQ